MVWENWGITPLCPVKNRMQMGIPAPSYLLARPGRWEQRSFCWDPRASSCHSKESWLDHFGLINKFVLPSQSLSSSPWTPLSTEQQRLTTHHYWKSMTELWTTLDHGGDYLPLASIKTLCFYFLSFLSPFFPSPSRWMTRICNKLVRPTFELLFLNLISGIHTSKNLLCLL